MNPFGKEFTKCPLKQLELPEFRLCNTKLYTEWHHAISGITNKLSNLQTYLIFVTRLTIFCISSFHARAQNYFGEFGPPGGWTS